MATKKGREISALPEASGLSGNEQFVLANNGENSKISASTVKQFVQPDLTGYVEKVEGKGLSSNDFTDTLKNKLQGIAGNKLWSSVNPGNFPEIQPGDLVMSYGDTKVILIKTPNSLMCLGGVMSSPSGGSAPGIFQVDKNGIAVGTPVYNRIITAADETYWNQKGCLTTVRYNFTNFSSLKAGDMLVIGGTYDGTDYKVNSQTIVARSVSLDDNGTAQNAYGQALFFDIEDTGSDLIDPTIDVKIRQVHQNSVDNMGDTKTLGQLAYKSDIPEPPKEYNFADLDYKIFHSIRIGDIINFPPASYETSCKAVVIHITKPTIAYDRVLTCMIGGFNYGEVILVYGEGYDQFEYKRIRLASKSDIPDLSTVPVSKNYREVTAENIQQIKVGDTVGGVYTVDSTAHTVAPWIVFEAGPTLDDEYPYTVWALGANINSSDTALDIYKWRLKSDGTLEKSHEQDTEGKYKIPSLKELKRYSAQTFIDLWTRCYDCQYDASKEKPFTCNGVELTYQEAIDVYNAPRISYPRPTGLCTYSEVPDMPKTFIFVKSSGSYSIQDLSRCFKGNSNLKIVRISLDQNSIRVNQLLDAFANCSNLEKILGIIGVNDINNANSVNSFTNSPKLKEVYIKYLKVNITFQWQSELSYESLRYLVDNAANTSPITVTVHSDVYNKLTGVIGGDIDDGEEGGEDWGRSTEPSTADWNQIVTDAAAKNITFATV